MKSDTTNWAYKLFKITEMYNYTIPSYHIDSSPKCYIEAFWRKTRLRLKENEAVMKALNPKKIEVPLAIRVFTNYFIC